MTTAAPRVEEDLTRSSARIGTVRSWTTGDRLFAAGLVLYAGYALLALTAGAIAAAAIPLGWHDRLHELAFTTGGAMGRRYAALADASHTDRSLGGLLLDYGFSAFNLALAGLLLWWRPRERTARLLVMALVGTATIFNLQAYAVYEELDPSLLDVVGNIGFHAVAAGAYTLALLLFPDGQLVPRWRTWPRTGLYLALLAAATYVALALRGASRTLSVLLLFGLLTPAVGVAAQGYRFLRGVDERERQQARTLFWALVPALAVGGYVLQQGLAASAFQVYGGRAITVIPVELFRVFQIAFSLILAALFAGIVRFRLWGIDRFITRALTYTLMAGIVTIVYVAVVVGVGRLVGARGDNLALSIVATGLVAMGFEPAREAVRRLVDRLVYGRRATPLEALAGFSAHIGEVVDPAEKLARLAQVVAEGTAARSAAVWLRVGDELRHAASWPAGDPGPPVPVQGEALPELPDASEVLPVQHEGELLGAVTLRLPAGESLAPVDERLLHGLAGQAGLALRNVRLTAELLDRVRELRASRQRMVTAQDEARRRLERNLHDGAQQQLVSLRIKIGLAARLAEQGRPVSEMLHQLGAEAEDAVTTMRELAHGIYPPLLAERGLEEALTSRIQRSHVSVAVEADGLGRYGQDVEAAAYFCCLEALQNVAKYADAEEVHVLLSDEGEWLRFRVTDDGCGFDAGTIPAGAGLQNMRDRVDALGGTLTISSVPGSGTLLEGWIPLDGARNPPGRDSASTTSDPPGRTSDAVVDVCDGEASYRGVR